MGKWKQNGMENVDAFERNFVEMFHFWILSFGLLI